MPTRRCIAQRATAAIACGSELRSRRMEGRSSKATATATATALTTKYTKKENVDSRLFPFVFFVSFVVEALNHLAAPVDLDATRAVGAASAAMPFFCQAGRSRLKPLPPRACEFCSFPCEAGEGARRAEGGAFRTSERITIKSTPIRLRHLPPLRRGRNNQAAQKVAPTGSCRPSKKATAKALTTKDAKDKKKENVDCRFFPFVFFVSFVVEAPDHLASIVRSG